jgi:hypothetical protein
VDTDHLQFYCPKEHCATVAQIVTWHRMGLSSLDIFRAAHELIEQHGEDEPIRSAMRSKLMLEKVAH